MPEVSMAVPEAAVKVPAVPVPGSGLTVHPVNPSVPASTLKEAANVGRTDKKLIQKHNSVFTNINPEA
jgi:hypothetical protein